MFRKGKFILAVLFLVFIYSISLRAQSRFIRGDANSDGTVSMSDNILIRRWLFLGKEAPACMDAADANDDGIVNLADCITILSKLYCYPYLFPEPYPIPGFDPTEDEYLCEDVEIIPGEKTEDLITIGDVEVGVGQEVLIPVYLTHAEPIEAFQLVISYDPNQFTPYPATQRPETDGLIFTNSIMKQIYDGKIAFSDSYINEEDGYMVIGAFQSFNEDHPIPAGEDQLLLEIRGRISDTVEVGDSIAITPTNGLNDEGTGVHHLRNEITLTGAAKYVSFYPRTKGGNLRIKDNPLTMDFLRGDVNSDGRVDLGDAIFDLNYLFANGKKPSCTDAADSNDDGKLDLSDPVFILDYLFGGVSKPTLMSKLTEFGGVCQPDMTADNLRGCVYEHCP